MDLGSSNMLGHEASESLILEKKRICFPKVFELHTFMVKKEKVFEQLCFFYPNLLGSVVKINDTDKEAKPLRPET